MFKGAQMATTVCVSRGLHWTRGAAAGAVGLAIAAYSPIALADEGGISFWLPGQFGSLAAVPQQPGWSFAEISYHTSVSAGGDVAAAREVTIGRFTPTVTANLSGNLNAAADLALGNATYVLGTPVLGGQASVGMTGLFARSSADLAATVTGTVGPFPFTRSDTINSTVTGFGDLYPMGQLRWNHGVNNFMVYVTGDLPVGAYDSRRLANIGIGHYAVDSGVGYTYFNPQTGQEFSAVTGLTYNFLNPSTQYQNGVDWHLDFGVSQFVSKQVQLGVVGYLYEQVSGDSGAGDRVGAFQSRVVGVGPQIGVIFPFGSMQGYLNFKGYAEFDQQNRPAGWNAWITLSISPGAPTPPSAQPTLIRK
jgi:hypothetical protein